MDGLEYLIVQINDSILGPWAERAVNLLSAFYPIFIVVALYFLIHLRRHSVMVLDGIQRFKIHAFWMPARITPA